MVNACVLIVEAKVSALVTVGTAVATVSRLPAKPPAWLEEMTLIELLLSPLPQPTLPVPLPVPAVAPVDMGTVVMLAIAMEEVVGVIGI